MQKHESKKIIKQTNDKRYKEIDDMVLDIKPEYKPKFIRAE